MILSRQLPNLLLNKSEKTAKNSSKKPVTNWNKEQKKVILLENKNFCHMPESYLQPRNTVSHLVSTAPKLANTKASAVASKLPRLCSKSATKWNYFNMPALNHPTYSLGVSRTRICTTVAWKYSNTSRQKSREMHLNCQCLELYQKCTKWALLFAT